MWRPKKGFVRVHTLNLWTSMERSLTPDLLPTRSPLQPTRCPWTPMAVGHHMRNGWLQSILMMRITGITTTIAAVTVWIPSNPFCHCNHMEVWPTWIVWTESVKRRRIPTTAPPMLWTSAAGVCLKVRMCWTPMGVIWNEWWPTILETGTIRINRRDVSPWIWTETVIVLKRKMKRLVLLMPFVFKE